MEWEINMAALREDLQRLDAARSYAMLGMYLQSNEELEKMSRQSRYWPEVLAVKLAIFGGLKLWEMVEIVAVQLASTVAARQ